MPDGAAAVSLATGITVISRAVRARRVGADPQQHALLRRCFPAAARHRPSPVKILAVHREQIIASVDVQPRLRPAARCSCGFQLSPV